MSNDRNTSHREISSELSELQGSILRGVLGSITGMIVCVLVMLICALCQAGKLSITLQLFAGMVIGWFYRRFRGRRSKAVAYAAVGICTVLACILWAALLVLLPVFASSTQGTATDWGRLWKETCELLLLCAVMGAMGFFLTRKRTLLAYADWKRAPWHVAYVGGNGYSYNLLPETLPAAHPPACFAVHSRVAPGTRVIVEESTLRWQRRLRKDRVFSVRDIAGAVLGPSNGCNVLYDKDYQVLVTFAGSMEHADLMFLYLLQQNVPMDNAPAGWRSPAAAGHEPEPAEPSGAQRQFTLRLKRSTRMGFAGLGWFLLLIGLAFFLLIDMSALTKAERAAILFPGLAIMGMGIVCLRMGRACRVEADGEQLRVVSRFGRATEFSVRDVSSVFRGSGWIVFYDREFNPLAKVDSCLEDMDRLKEYLQCYGIRL